MNDNFALIINNCEAVNDIVRNKDGNIIPQDIRKKYTNPPLTKNGIQQISNNIIKAFSKLKPNVCLILCSHYKKSLECLCIVVKIMSKLGWTIQNIILTTELNEINENQIKVESVEEVNKRYPILKNESIVINKVGNIDNLLYSLIDFNVYPIVLTHKKKLKELYQVSLEPGKMIYLRQASNNSMYISNES